jgi:ribosomal protein S18 acetylase RimI-like enzyme
VTISIVPSRRGHGLGQELLDALLAAAREAGHKTVSLSVEADSPAVSFYERNGFTQVRESEGGLVMQRDL